MIPSKYSSEGNQGLSFNEKADRFIDWMYDEIKPFINGNILEVGSGIGTFSKKIVCDFQNNQIVLSDVDTCYVNNLKNIFELQKNVQIELLDLGTISDFEKIRRKLNTVIALNVLEHVENDIDALHHIYDALADNGKLILLVPAHKFLYNRIDESVGHYRRYSKKELLEKIGKTKFKIHQINYFNFAAILGWYINGNILKKSISESTIGFFNKLVPFFKFFEKNFTRKKMGISLIVILEK